MTTLLQFVQAVQAVEVSGVRRQFGSPPTSITTSDMPALWVQAVQVRDEPAARGGIAWPTLTAELYLVVCPVAQTRPDTFADLVTLADALRAALMAADLAVGPATVTVRVATLDLGGKGYWGVVGVVEARG